MLLIYSNLLVARTLIVDLVDLGDLRFFAASFVQSKIEEKVAQIPVKDVVKSVCLKCLEQIRVLSFSSKASPTSRRIAQIQNFVKHFFIFWKSKMRSFFTPFYVDLHRTKWNTVCGHRVILNE